MQAETTDFSERLASLTPQQFRVLGMLAEGLLNKQIAYDLDVSEATIKAHITAVFRKLGVRNRTQAVIAIRSEEHTSELQSRPHLVCRLLLEKKKKQKLTHQYHYANKHI